MSLWQKIALDGSLVLAASAGVFASIAFSAGTAQTPSKTVTITLTNGATGPAGPQGPPGERGPAGATGPSGVSDCPAGSTFGKLVIIVQGKGPVSILTCIVDE